MGVQKSRAIFFTTLFEIVFFSSISHQESHHFAFVDFGGEKISILLIFEFIVRLRTKTSFAQGKGVKTLSKTETISSERPLLHPP